MTNRARVALVFFAILFVALASSFSVDNTYHKRYAGDGSTPTAGATVVCTTVYYKVCSASGCLDSTGAGSCCGDCRNDDGTFAPCTVCKAN